MTPAAHSAPPLIAGTETLTVGPLAVHLLPRSAALADQAIDETLTDTERAYASSVKSVQRRDEYRRARYLIRRLTGFAGPLPASSAGVPSWPPGRVGSITHKDGHVGITLADAAAFRAVGVDAEDTARLRPEYEPRLASPAEAKLLTALTDRGGRSRADWLTALFSFKEALFKSHFPLGQVMFYFLDAEIDELTPASDGTWQVVARVLRDTSSASPAGSRWHGACRFHAVDGATLALTTAWVAHPASGVAGNDLPT